MQYSRWFVSKVVVSVKTSSYHIWVGAGMGLNWIACEQVILSYLFEVVEFVTV